MLFFNRAFSCNRKFYVKFLKIFIIYFDCYNYKKRIEVIKLYLAGENERNKS